MTLSWRLKIEPNLVKFRGRVLCCIKFQAQKRLTPQALSGPGLTDYVDTGLNHLGMEIACTFKVCNLALTHSHIGIMVTAASAWGRTKPDQKYIVVAGCAGRWQR